MSVRIKAKVYIRADGSSLTGLGHVYRSFALSDLLRDVFECILVIRSPEQALRQTANKYFNRIIEIPATASLEEELALFRSLLTDMDVAVLDGYAFDTRYQEHLKLSGCKLVCIDDIHAYKFVADVVINHALGIDESMYVLGKESKLFIGPEFALIRKDFLHQALVGKKEGDRNTFFICLGGADPSNTTLTVLQQLYKLARNSPCFLQVDLVLGSAYKFEDSLTTLPNIKNIRLNISRDLSEDMLITIMQESSIAVCTPSTICFEYASVSTGRIYLCKTAENQSDFYDHLIQNGFAKDFLLDFNFENNGAETNRNRFVQLIDGKQGERILDIFNTLIN